MTATLASPRVQARPQLRPGVSFAFQPIVDVASRRVVSYEALIRGSGGEPAHQVLQRVPTSLLGEFDARAREHAIRLAAQLGIDCELNLNFLPKSLLASSGILDRALTVARSCGVALDRLVLEVSETELVDDHAAFAQAVSFYRQHGLKFSLDDFGAGYSGLKMLAEFQPDQLKLDMSLVRGIDSSGPRQAIVRALAHACTDLGIDLLAECVETVQEYRWLRSIGITLFQGYLFARPGFAFLPPVTMPPD